MAELRRHVHAAVDKTSDIQIRVSTVTTEWGNFAEIREYVVSLDQYGRGITFPADQKILNHILSGLESVEASDA